MTDRELIKFLADRLAGIGENLTDAADHLHNTTPELHNCGKDIHLAGHSLKVLARDLKRETTNTKPSRVPGLPEGVAYVDSEQMIPGRSVGRVQFDDRTTISLLLEKQEDEEISSLIGFTIISHKSGVFSASTTDGYGKWETSYGSRNAELKDVFNEAGEVFGKKVANYLTGRFASESHQAI